MPDYLLQLDHKLFYFFNHTLTNRFFDWIMPYLRYPQFWIPVYAFILIFCLARYKKQGVIIILLLVATFAVSDFGSAHIAKPLVKRLRPCNDPAMAQTITRRVDCGTGYSFPSSHSSNHFAMAVFLIAVFHKRWKGIWFWCLLWAILVSVAQLYVGVHYPIDILAGAIYGTIVGYLFGSVLKRKFVPDF